jgi:hypothetical protein
LRSGTPPQSRGWTKTSAARALFKPSRFSALIWSRRRNGAVFAPDFFMATAANPPMDVTLPAISTAAVMHIGHIVFRLSPFR